MSGSRNNPYSNNRREGGANPQDSREPVRDGASSSSYEYSRRSTERTNGYSLRDRGRERVAQPTGNYDSYQKDQNNLSAKLPQSVQPIAQSSHVPQLSYASPAAKPSYSSLHGHQALPSYGSYQDSYRPGASQLNANPQSNGSHYNPTGQVPSGPTLYNSNSGPNQGYRESSPRRDQRDQGRYDRYDSRDRGYSNGREYISYDRQERTNSYRGDAYSRNDYRGDTRKSSYNTRNDSYRNDRNDSYRNDRNDRNDSYNRNDSYRGNSRNDSYNPRNETRVDPSNEERPVEKAPAEPIPVQIAKITSRLKTLEDVSPLSELKIIDSRWGVKPKGFEKVTAQRAKLSGLFPLPGYPRPIDFTKLEGMLKDRLTNANDILNEGSKIDPIDSKNSTVLIIKGVDFETVNHLKVVEYFNDFLKKIDIDQTDLQNVESKRKTKDDTTLIVKFKNNTCATIIFSALNGTELPTAVLEEDASTSKMVITRPNEYVVQILPPNKAVVEDIEEAVIDSPRKLSIHVPTLALETEILTELNQIAQVKAFQLLREIGTKQSLGVAFVEFYLDASTNEKAIPELQGLITKASELALVESIQFACIVPEVTSIQECPIDFTTIRKLVKNVYVLQHPKLRVVQLLNVVTAKDLVQDENFKFIQQDIKTEASQFGVVVSMKIPRPANDYTPGIVQFTQPGLGKIFIEFEDEKMAFKAIMELAGRMYNDRTVLCAFYDEGDYKNGLF